MGQILLIKLNLIKFTQGNSNYPWDPPLTLPPPAARAPKPPCPRCGARIPHRGPRPPPRCSTCWGRPCPASGAWQSNARRRLKWGIGHLAIEITACQWASYRVSQLRALVFLSPLQLFCWVLSWVFSWGLNKTTAVGWGIQVFPHSWITL